MQLVILGPGDIAQAHTKGEWIAIDQLHRAVEVYRKLIEHFCMSN
jgi:acetylornithine deacetylase